MNDVRNQSAWWRWWWPAIVMLAIIFIGSTDLGAMSHQWRFLVPFLRWLGLGEAAIHAVVLAIRKIAHLSEYALLAIFLWRAWMRRPVLRPPAAWPWTDALAPFFLCAVFAGLDEFHQSFVPSRSASLGDVLVDLCGGVIGLALLWRWHRRQLARPGA